MKFLQLSKVHRLQIILIIIFLITIPSTILGISTYRYMKDILIKDAQKDMMSIYANANDTLKMLSKLVDNGTLTREQAIEEARETIVGPKDFRGMRDFRSSSFKYGKYGNLYGFYIDTTTWTPKFLFNPSDTNMEDMPQAFYKIPTRESLLNSSEFPKNIIKQYDYILSENGYYNYAGKQIWELINQKITENNGFFEKNMDPLPGVNPNPNDKDYFSKVHKKTSYVNYVPSWSRNENFFGKDTIIVLVVTGFDFEMIDPINRLAILTALVIFSTSIICITLSYLFIRRKKESKMAKQESVKILLKIHESIDQIRKEFPNFSEEIEVNIKGNDSETYLYDKIDQLLKENKEQFKLIQEKNLILEQYSNKIEELTIHEERNRINRELHDTIGYTFTAIVLGLENIKNILEHNPEEAKKKIDSLESLSRETLNNTRNTIHQSGILTEYEGLSSKMLQITEDFSSQTNVGIQFNVYGEEIQLSNSFNLCLIRCLQESLANAVKHGNTREIRVTLNYQEESVALSIQDNGKGNEKLSFGYGLSTMKDRIDALRGRLVVSSTSNGTKIDCELPIEKVKKLSKGVRVLLADDQELIRESLAVLLHDEDDIEIVGTCQNGLEAVQMCSLYEPNIILMDIHMPEMDGIEATKAIKEKYPNVKIIILTTFQDIGYAIDAIKYGAEGYLIKSIRPKQLVDSIRLVSTGNTLISKDIATLIINQVTDNPSSLSNKEEINLKVEYGLTDREIDLLYYLAEGYKYKIIAEKMDLSENTIKNYISTIYSKLNVKNRMQAVKLLNHK
ncbi:hybrid sensor histidine kinase/response regulator transcription factor [Bacillus sp. S/N-304-OC-R1]|uniref:helix-turn-helix transcriptional regulator n=1 Tax=Bacillus sp. S/N-304-OC-R1 TaxID=2758034 RepID=UPI001C8E541B|nr:hybrid sensor histidine kinase/response regulator transcription factor [Bacillus sp. S/N-304-OC-R1]MBY0121207.1 response regulator [Bacillus sp. S/N-304-OC-R1]